MGVHHDSAGTLLRASLPGRLGSGMRETIGDVRAAGAVYGDEFVGFLRWLSERVEVRMASED